MTTPYFDAVASDWDRMRQQLFPDSLRDEAADAMRIGPGKRYLDVGAGTGFLTSAILARGAQAVAVDASPKMVEVLRRRFPGLDAREADAERLPFPDASFDGALANMCLHHAERPAAMIREMARVVKPGGRVVVTDLDAHDHEFLRVEHHDRWMGFAREDVATCSKKPACATSRSDARARAAAPTAPAGPSAPRSASSSRAGT